jgi:hypothetical protein
MHGLFQGLLPGSQRSHSRNMVCIECMTHADQKSNDE